MPLPRCLPRLSPGPSSLPEERSRFAFLPPAGRKPPAALSVLCRREKVRYGNIMIDPRVVRGNVLSARPPPPQVWGFAKVHHATVLFESHR